MPLTRQDKVYALACIVGAWSLFLFLLVYGFTLTPPRDASGYIIGHDFLNDWMGARAVLSGEPESIFDYSHYQSLLRDAFGSVPEHVWSYPPHLFLFIWPLGLLPYFWALTLWSLTGFGGYLYAATRGGAGWQEVLFLAVGPAVLENIYSGQNAFFISAFLIGGLTLLDRRPLIAGLLFGLATLKPQLGILIPVMLMASGRWRVFSSAIITTIALVLATGWMFGGEIWTNYVQMALPIQTEISFAADSPRPTVLSSARMIGASMQTAYLVQLIASVTAAGIVAWAYMKSRNQALSNALLVTATFLATPYSSPYDFIIFSWVIVHMRRNGSDTYLDTVLNVAVWFLPFALIGYGPFHVHVTILILLAFAARLTWRLWHNECAACSGSIRKSEIRMHDIDGNVPAP